MMCLKQIKKGFTLIELIMVIVVLGVLAVVAMPKFFNLSPQANLSAEQGVVGGVRSGISTYLLQNKGVFLAVLDSATNGACAVNNVCFSTVLTQGGVTSGWIKNSNTSYTGPSGTDYTYTIANGDFK